MDTGRKCMGGYKDALWGRIQGVDVGEDARRR